MTLLEDKWSDDLKSIRPRLKNVFYKGDAQLLQKDLIRLAIVGSRKITDYGKSVVEKWMPELVRKGVVIVSGFMYGVDQVAHRSCLENGGKTIAVLGCGIESRPSSFDEKLYQKIVEEGSLIVSEYPDDYPADKWTFPQRNRIVAGLSDAVLVVEAAEKSGSLITARLAQSFGKPLLAVPGSVFSKVSMGTNSLIEVGKAKAVTSVSDVLKELGLGAGQMKMNLKEQSSEPILSVLEAGERSVDEITRALKEPVSKVLERLFVLETDGLIREVGGKFKLTL